MGKSLKGNLKTSLNGDSMDSMTSDKTQEKPAIHFHMPESNTEESDLYRHEVQMFKEDEMEEGDRPSSHRSKLENDTSGKASSQQKEASGLLVVPQGKKNSQNRSYKDDKYGFEDSDLILCSNSISGLE